MEPQNAADAYRQASIENAPPIKIVRMLYQGALRFLDRAAQEDPASADSKFFEYLERVDAIVTELRIAIDSSVDGAPTEDLERLYLFCEDQIGSAGLERSSERLASVRQVLETLLEAWKGVELEVGTVR